MPKLSNLIDEKIVRILTVLHKNKSKLYHITQLAQEAQVPPATTLRLMKIILKSDIVKVSNVGKLKIYSYNNSEENNSLMKVLKI